MSQSTLMPDDNVSFQANTTLGSVHFDQKQSVWHKIIAEHPYNYQVGLFLPFCTSEAAQTRLANPLSYYHAELRLVDLLSTDFMHTYIQSGEHDLLLHTIDTHLDTDDVFTLDHTGRLVLSLNKDTYERFGITTQKRRQADAIRQKYVVEIDLRNTKDKRRHASFANITQSFKVVALCVHRDTGELIDIRWPEGVKAEKKEISPQVEQLDGVSIPDLGPLAQETPKDVWQKNVLDALEWLGLAYVKANRIRTDDQPDPFVSLYQTPTPFTAHQTGTLVRWRGLIAPFFVRHLAVSMRKMMADKTLPSWAALTVWGYRDSPYTWSTQEHHYFLNGENDYTFLLLPTTDKDVTLIHQKMLGTHHILH